jgi:chromosome segregation protein
LKIKRLELSGFKSFVDRTVVNFDHEIMGIVGPNGCGKSNIVDAIRWSMGEQSAKHLRGRSMEDVIFNGSESRAPADFAEVTLTFENDDPTDVPLEYKDYAEIAVTRRLHRSGDSEYLINKTHVRLKDITDLFLGTGVGTKAYSIVEQGKIGLIVSARPEDRRLLIEEAAGITKYKSRRRAAELKLEAAQQNLTRIDDIVFEVEKQRGTLKRQAAKARRYKRLRDELRRWEKVLFARRYRELAASIEGARTRLAQARERETGAAARLAELEADLSRLRIELAEADQRASSLREDAHARELDLTARQHQQEFSKQQAESLAGRATSIEDEIRDLEARREPARIALDTRRAAAVAAERERDDAAARLASATQEHADSQRGIEVLEGDVDAVRSEVFAHANTATALRHAIQHAIDQTDRVGTTLSELDVERDDLRRETEGV